jgi:predicted RNA binding protein YcfA (HicA-like mRNA interferase family)
MPKRLTQDEIETVLRDHGFPLARQSGSHRIWTDGVRTTVVPAHGKAVSIGTLCAIIRQSGLPRGLFR